MNILAKQPERSNITCIFKDAPLSLPEPGAFFAAYDAVKTKGSMFTDDSAMSVRVFELPALKLQWVFERGRVRLEDRGFRQPKESVLAAELSRVLPRLYPDRHPTAYGYNYDIIYRMDNVIPLRDIMSSFMKPESLEGVRDFGWQYSIAKEKGRRSETYFFKAVSPIEIAVHSNFHFENPIPVTADDFETEFERFYANTDKALTHMSF
jgi:hypothetical protein